MVVDRKAKYFDNFMKYPQVFHLVSLIKSSTKLARFMYILYVQTNLATKRCYVKRSGYLPKFYHQHNNGAIKLVHTQVSRILNAKQINNTYFYYHHSVKTQ